MKKLIISLSVFCIFGLIAKSQSDTMYVMKNGIVINKQPVNSLEVDSIIFYNPQNQQVYVIDIDGNTYNIITIGSQVWLKENLKTTKYNDGSSIPLVSNETEWYNLNKAAFCYYNNDSTLKNTYGLLYNWYTVSTNKLCPIGWHVPTDSDWNVLITYLGGNNIAGGKLKEIGTTHWINPNIGASNESNFTALPGGYRDSNGVFYGVGYNGHWWSSTELGSNFAWERDLFNNLNSIDRTDNNVRSGTSVRCIWDLSK